MICDFIQVSQNTTVKQSSFHNLATFEIIQPCKDMLVLKKGKASDEALTSTTKNMSFLLMLFENIEISFV